MAEENDDKKGGQDPTGPGGRLNVDRLVAEHGDATRALAAMTYKVNDLERDNANYRQRIREMKGQLPSENAVVLTDEDDVQAITQLRQVGTLKEVVTKLGEGTEAVTKLKAHERSEMLTSVSSALGANHAVLRLLDKDDYSYRVEDYQENGEAKKKVWIREGNGNEMLFPEFAKQAFSDDENSALYAQKQDQAGDDEKPRPGNRFVHQPPTNNNGEKGAKVTREQRAESQRARGLNVSI